MTGNNDDILDESKSINGKSITVGWLLESLRENDKVFQQKHGNHKVKNVSFPDFEKQGFICDILQCVVIFTDSEEVYTTLLKVPGIEGVIRATRADASNQEIIAKLAEPVVAVHKVECDFYNHLAPIVKIPIPLVFKTQEWIPGKQDGCIHMEDLSRHGKTLTFFDEISIAQIQTVIRHIAKMHKNILESDPKIWEGKYPTNPEGLNRFIDMMMPTIDAFMMITGTEDTFKPILEKYGKFLTNKQFFKFALLNNFQHLNIQPLIVHGDLHNGNIIWTTVANGKVTDEVAAFIDWQIIYEASPMNDLARFLAMSPSGTTRREAEKFVIDYYLECFKKEFDGDETKIPYNHDQLQKSYDLVFLTQVIFLFSNSVFFLHSMDAKGFDEVKKEEYKKKAVEKVQMACEDAIQIINGDLKAMLEKLNF